MHNLITNSENDSSIYVDDFGNAIVNPGDGRPITIGIKTYTTYPQIRMGDGVTVPTIVEGGASMGWLFTVGDLVYFEVPLHSQIDRTREIVIHLGWASIATETSKLVSWKLESTAITLNKNLTVIDSTLTDEDIAVPAAAVYAHASFTIPASVFSNSSIFELHGKLSRIASSNDPVNEPALHHIAVVQQLK